VTGASVSFFLQLWGQRVVKKNAMSATPSSQACPSPSNEGFVQIMAVVFVISGRERQVEEPVSCGFASGGAANSQGWPSAEVRRRMFKPTHELMCENLPEPDI
jgi:hypothetical protein